MFERILVREPPNSCDVTNEREQLNIQYMEYYSHENDGNMILLALYTESNVCLFVVMIAEKMIFAPHHQKYYSDEDCEMP